MEQKGNTQKPRTFKDFLGRNWWFMLLAFMKALGQSKKESPFGSTFLDIVFAEVLILMIMYIYFFIKYARKNKNTNL